MEQNLKSRFDNGKTWIYRRAALGHTRTEEVSATDHVAECDMRDPRAREEKVATSVSWLIQSAFPIRGLRTGFVHASTSQRLLSHPTQCEVTKGNLIVPEDAYPTSAKLTTGGDDRWFTASVVQTATYAKVAIDAVYTATWNGNA